MRKALPLEGLLTGRRWTVTASLLALVALAWAYLIAMVADHGGAAGAFGPGMGMLDGFIEICRIGAAEAGRTFGMPLHAGPWGAVDLGLLLLMWAVMSVAMMLPTAAPMILTFADISATRLEGRALLARVGVFAGGYLAVWGAFAVAATGLQWGLREAALMTPQMTTANPWLAGGLLLAAGAYQFTPLKDLCLSQCRNPMTWFMGHWKPGARGAWSMGTAHGAWCLGCCWALMLVMIAAGAMNLVWMAVLAALMLAEKVLPRPALVGRAAGVVLLGWGVAVVSVAF